MFTQSGNEYWSFPVQTRWPSSCQHQECFTGGYPLVSHLLKGTESRFSPPWLSVRSGCYPVVFFSVILTHSLHDPCPTKGIDFFFPRWMQPNQISSCCTSAWTRSQLRAMHRSSCWQVLCGLPRAAYPPMASRVMRCSALSHHLSFLISPSFSEPCSMLGFLEDLPEKNMKNRNSCLFIYLSITSLSTEALKSGPLWIRLAAMWTWRVVARSWLYQEISLPSPLSG